MEIPVKIGRKKTGDGKKTLAMIMLSKFPEPFRNCVKRMREEGSPRNAYDAFVLSTSITWGFIEPVN